MSVGRDCESVQTGLVIGVPTLTTRELLAHNLARLLEKRGMTAAELGQRLALGPTPSRAASNLRRYGVTRWPSPERLDELAEALGCRPAEFFVDP